jgi:hypothetical protein
MMDVVVSNIGCEGATNVSAVLSTTTPGVTVEQSNSTYPDMGQGGSGSNAVPFQFSTSAAFACGIAIDFTLTVTTDQGMFVTNFSKPTCQTPTMNISGSIAAGDTTMTGRIVRNGVASSCSIAKVYPGTQDLLANRRYDAHTFTNSGNATACVTVNVTSSCGTNIFYAVYSGSFNPANVSQNYLADAGSSFAGTATFSFNVPAGQTFVLVIHEVNVGAGCGGYTGTVSGLLSGADGGGVCETCMINSQSDITVANDPGQCGAVVNYPAPSSTGSCGVLTSSPASGSFFPVGTTTVTVTSTSGASSSFDVIVNDTESPTLSDPVASPAVLWPPNHSMRDVMVNYTASDNCPLTCVLSVMSNEPVDGTGDGDTSPDWEIVDSQKVRLRAERAGSGNGRIYTITTTCTDGSGNSISKSTEVVVAHNITSPISGAAFKINTPVNFSGTFWDVNGKTHTGQFVVDNTTIPGTVVEPKGLANGTVKGTYTFNTPGVYKVSMKVTDSSGVSTLTSTAGDLEAIVVIYDPSGGYTIGGGWVTVPAGSYWGNFGLTGKLGFGFNSKYTNAKNPKGETGVIFKLGNFEFNSLNYDYLVISGNRAQFQGFGKVNGDPGYNFILTVVDGDLKGGDGVDRFRLKIWNRNTGVVVFDNQLGASDAADPTAAVGLGSSIVIKK